MRYFSVHKKKERKVGQLFTRLEERAWISRQPIAYFLNLACIIMLCIETVRFHRTIEYWLLEELVHFWYRIAIVCEKE